MLRLLLGLLLTGLLLAEAPASQRLSGKLRQPADAGPYLELPDSRKAILGGDKDTQGVLNDARLKGAELVVKGRWTSPDHFEIDPIHTKAMHVHKGDKDLLITYWCDVCSIRTYTPGKCWCCQDETALDLKEPGNKEAK